jgi:hypothetical protein
VAVAAARVGPTWQSGRVETSPAAEPAATSTGQLIPPAYGGGSVADLVPALLEPNEFIPDFLAPEIIAARSVVMLVIDGLGWEQLRSRMALTPTLAELSGGPITTVAPTTTATALTSISTGAPPGEHGIIGYRMATDIGVLNVLRWTTPHGDARSTIPPDSIQGLPAFLGHRPPVVSKAEFARSGFTRAHLAGTRLTGYRTVSSIPVEVRRLVRAGEPFVYSYYDALDRIAHEYGLGEHYEAELVACDRLVADILTALPMGTALLVTADHGQVDCTDGEVELDAGVRSLIDGESGEARFRWLHAQPGRASELMDTVAEAHGHQAWIRSRDQVIEEGWLGPIVSDQARLRLGDIALVAREKWAFVDPADSGPIDLLGRHGSLTADEMLVPALGLVV